MTRKRVILLVIVLGMLLGIGGGIWWYLRRNSGWRLLSRAQVAIQAEQYDEAAELAAKYRQRNPKNWQGYYWGALAYKELGRYGDARELLDKVRAEVEAGRMTADMTRILRLLADTYAMPALETLGERAEASQPEELRDAARQLEKANDILDRVEAEADDAVALRSQSARNLMWIGLARRMLAESDEERAASRALLMEAAQEHLAVLREDPSLQPAAERLVRLCRGLGDAKLTDSAREVMLGAEDVAPGPAARLIMMDLPPAPGPDGAYRPNRNGGYRQKLDELIERHPDEVLPQVVRAQLAVLEGDLGTAERLCGGVLERHPSHRLARLVKARTAYQRGEYDEAARELSVLNSDEPNWPAALYAHGQALEAAGNEAYAQDRYDKVLELEPHHRGAFLARVTYLSEEGLDHDAFRVAMKHYEARPGSRLAVGYLVDLAVRTEQPTVAKEALASAVDEWSGEPGNLLVAADGYRMLGEAETAASLVEQAAAVEPEGPAEVRAVADAMVRLGRLEEAEALIRRHHDADPSAPLAHMLGRVFARTGRTFQAVDMYRQAIDLGGTSGPVVLDLAAALFEAQDYEAAEDVLADAPPDDPRTEYLRFRLALARGEEAAAEMEPAAGEGGASSLAKAMDYLRAGRPEDCLRVCRTLAEESPGSTAPHWLMGRAHLQMGQLEECVSVWKQALSDEPGQASRYRDLAAVLAGDGAAVDDVRAELSAIPNARSALVEIACGWLHLRRGEPDEAIDLYRNLTGRADVTPDMRGRARLGLIRALADAGKVPEAIAELDDLAAQEAWRPWANRVKARLVAADGNLDAAKDLLAEQFAAAHSQQSMPVMRQVVNEYVRLGLHEAALQALDKMLELQPDSHGVLIRKAAVLRRTGQLSEATAACEKAIAAQPHDLNGYRMLARMRDEQLKLGEALDVLERMERLGPSGRVTSLVEQGILLAGWGLHQPALEAIQEASEHTEIHQPRIQYGLARALAGLGATDKARAALRGIPSYSPYHMRARLLLSAMEEDVGDRLGILADLQESHPARLDVLSARMAALVAAAGPAEAVEAFRAFRAQQDEDRSMPSAIASQAVKALLADDEVRAAAELADEMREATGAPQWHVARCLLLAMSAEPNRALEFLPEPDGCAFFEAAVGLIAAERAGASVTPWAARIRQLQEQARASDSPANLPMVHRLLAAWAAGDEGRADELLRELEARPDELGLSFSLVAEPAGRPKPAEASRLLAATVAQGIGLVEWGGRQALSVLREHPECHLAAAMALGQGAAPVDTVLELIRPTDAPLALAVRGASLAAEQRHEEAVALFAASEDAVRADPSLQLQYGYALEQAGRLEQAEALYRQLWADVGAPVAANNAAYVMVRRHGPDDAEALEEAMRLAEQAVEAAPRAPGFRDTLGWIALLRGREDKALTLLRQAIKAMPEEPEVHYHLGRAEFAAGNARLARLHLQAAVDLTERYEREGNSSEAQREAAAAAREWLQRKAG